MAVSLRPSKAPNLLVAPVDYDQRYQDQLNNALRLYFNQIDTFTGFIAQPISGTSAERPAINLHIGQMYFDTNPGLGIPVWWNGTNWVDATGTVRVAAIIAVTGVKTVGRIGTVTVTTV
jgi:hypothetical protein